MNNITPDEVIEFCKEFFPKLEKRTETEYLAQCPWHNDENPSLSLNIQKGVYNCFAATCGASGSIYKLMSKGKKEVQPVNEEFIMQCKKDLYENRQHVLDYLVEDLQWNVSQMKKDDVGYYAQQDRITIPVYDPYGVCYTLKLYNPKSNPKWKYYKQGKSMLYPLYELQHEQIIICEGEKDRLKLASEGFHAITATSGAGNFEVEWIPYFNDKEVYIVYDSDLSGKKGSKKVYNLLKNVAKSISIVSLPFELTKSKGKDVTDYFIELGKTKEDFQNLLQQTEKIVKITADDKRWISLIQSENEYREVTDFIDNNNWVPTWVKYRDISKFDESQIEGMKYKDKISIDFAIKHLHKSHLKAKLHDIRKDFDISDNITILDKQNAILKELQGLKI